MDIWVLSLWVFLAWYLPEIEEESGSDSEGKSDASASTMNSMGHLYINEGEEFQKAAKYPEAIESFKEAVRLSPAHPRAHYGLGKSYVLAQRYNKAIKPLRRAIKLSPAQSSLPYIYLGWVNHRLGYFERAIKPLSEALLLEGRDSSPDSFHQEPPPDDAGIFKKGLKRLKLVFGNGAEPAAEKHVATFEKLRQNLGFSAADNGAGKKQLKLVFPAGDDKNGGKVEFDGQNLIDTRLAVTFYRYGLAHFKLEDYDQAIKELSEAVRLDPEFADAHYALGLAYERVGRQHMALSEFSETLNEKPSFHEAEFKLAEAGVAETH